MNKDDLSILVIGAGAVGGITAALLCRSGYNVSIVAKYSDYARKINDEGILINGACGECMITMPAFTSVEEVSGTKDIILLATKAADMPEAAKNALSLLSPGGYMLSMQNGICEHELAEIAGAERTVGCVVGWGATMNGPGDLLMTSKGDFIIGYTDRQPDDDLHLIAEVLSSVVPVRVSGNITGHRYSKLIINSCITSPGAICGLYLGQMLSIPRMRHIFINIIREAVFVADAMGIKVETFGGKLDFYKFIRSDSLFARFKRNMMIRIIGFKYRKLKSSSLQSLERGKPTEIPWLNGFIVRNARKHNIHVPVNEKITELVQQIEQGKREIGIENFNDPVFD